MVQLVRSRMSKVHPCRDNDKSSSSTYVGDDFFQELTCNFEPQNQVSDRHVVEEFSTEAAFHREWPSPEHFKNKILRDLFIHSNTTIPSSAAIERLFSVGEDVLKPKRSGLTDQNFELLVYLEGACH